MLRAQTGLPSCDTPDSFLQNVPYVFWEAEARIFSTWGADVTSAATPEMQEIRMLSTPDTWKGEKTNTATQWTLAMWGRERARQGENVIPTNPNALTEAQHHSMLKGRIEAYGAAGGIRHDFDIGAGVRFGIVAIRAQLKLLAPTGYLENPDPAATLSGLVLDSYIGASLSPAPSVPGRQLLTDTYVYVLAAGNVNTHIDVPGGAVRVTIYQSNVGQIIDPHWRTFADVAAANLGEIVLGADRRVDHLEVPGPAKVINLNPAADQQNNRTVTVIWELEM